MHNWQVDLENRQVTHHPSGLVMQFTPSTDGSGAMQVDLLNPEALPTVANQEELAFLERLPLEAWQVYADAVEAVLQKTIEVHSDTPVACRCRA